MPDFIRHFFLVNSDKRLDLGLKVDADRLGQGHIYLKSLSYDWFSSVTNNVPIGILVIGLLHALHL